MAQTAGSTAFRTRQLPPEEEVKQLQLWEMILDHLVDDGRPQEHGSSTRPPVQKIARPPLRSRSSKKALLGRLRRSNAADGDNGSSSSSTSSSPTKTSSGARTQHRIRAGTIIPTQDWIETIKVDDPDQLITRFLAQQKWDVEKAFECIVYAVHWRNNEMHVDDLLRWGDEGALNTLKHDSAEKERSTAEGFLLQQRTGKTFVCGEDRHGRPVQIVRAKLHKPSLCNTDSMQRYTVWHIEMTRLMMGHQKETVQLFDLSDMTPGNLDLSHMRFTYNVIATIYPRSVNKMIIHNAPILFESTWKIMKGLMSPEAKARVVFTRSVKDLEQFITRKNIPRALGGDLQWEYEYKEAQPEENALMLDEGRRDVLRAERSEIAARFHELTRDLIDATRDGDDTADIKYARKQCADRLNAMYWELDPFQRARGIYDRLGSRGHPLWSRASVKLQPTNLGADGSKAEASRANG